MKSNHSYLILAILTVLLSVIVFTASEYVKDPDLEMDQALELHWHVAGAHHSAPASSPVFLVRFISFSLESVLMASLPRTYNQDFSLQGLIQSATLSSTIIRC